MTARSRECPDCDRVPLAVCRRDFLRATGAGVATAVAAGTWAGVSSAAKLSEGGESKTLVGLLYESLSEEQRKAVAFDWDYVDPSRGLLRTRVGANWRITDPAIYSDFYTADQQQMIRGIFEGMIDPDWIGRFDKQLQDDDDGFGTKQRIAIFGTPASGPFEFVLTGRHMTLRCDGNSAQHVAFGGPIFYGHAASGFTEKPGHPGNVFWPQARAANAVYKMLDGRQRKQALIAQAPAENKVGFRGPDGAFPGIRIAELTADQKEHAQLVLQKLIEPYRQSDRNEVVACLKSQGGLDECHLAFYQNPDLGDDGVWDVWRLEGPAFVWHFRGSPHVHTWVHVADDPSGKLNA